MIEVSEANINGSPQSAPPTACLVGACDLELWGLSQTERLRRGLRAAGVESCLEAGSALPDQGRVILLRLDYVYEQRLLVDLVASPGTVLSADDDHGCRVAVAAHVGVSIAEETAELLSMPRLDDAAAQRLGLVVVGAGELSTSYDKKLRKKAAPYLLHVDREAIGDIEARMFAGSYKGVTDFVTKWLWPAPASHVTRWAARRQIKPNMVTFLSFLLVLLALWLFAQGCFASGLLAAWVMTFLDTVDGKLARVTLTSSAIGNVFDHGIDLVHPPFWYAAWAVGLTGVGATAPSHIDLALWIIVGGYVIGRLLEGLFIALFGLEIHAWRPIDSWFRLFTARRNPNLLLLSVATLLARPDSGFVAVAMWTVVSLGFHIVRVVQAMALRLRGSVPASWLAL